MNFKVGDTHKVANGHPEGAKIHVMGVFDGEQITYKYYSRRLRAWRYRVDHADTLKMRIEHRQKVKRNAG